MLKNYLLVAFRNLRKNKTFSFINITGLALGMACSLLILLWVNDEPIVLVVFTGHHRGTTAALHDTIAQVAAYVVQHYGGRVSADFKDKSSQ